jgi:hypothetical protein
MPGIRLFWEIQVLKFQARHGNRHQWFWQQFKSKKKAGAERVNQSLRTGYDNGVFFWESADQYGTHPAPKGSFEKS